MNLNFSESYKNWLGVAGCHKVSQGVFFSKHYSNLRPNKYEEFVAASFLTLGGIGGGGGVGITALLASQGILPMASATVLTTNLLIGGAIALGIPAVYSIFNTIKAIFDNYLSKSIPAKTSWSLLELGEKLLKTITSFLLPLICTALQVVSTCVYLMKALVFLFIPSSKYSSVNNFELAGKAYKDIFTQLTASLVLPLINLYDLGRSVGTNVKSFLACNDGEEEANSAGYKPI